VPAPPPPPRVRRRNFAIRLEAHRSITTEPALQYPHTLRTSHSLAMFSSKLTRVANRATNITTANPAPAQWTASQCFATTTQRRPHQRRQSSSKASCPPDSSNKAAKAAENATQASEVEKTPRRASRIKRAQVDKSAKGKEEANQFAGLPTVPDTRHVGEKGMDGTTDTTNPCTDILARLLAFHFLQLTPSALSGQPYPPARIRGDFQQHIRVKAPAGRLGKRKLSGEEA